MKKKWVKYGLILLVVAIYGYNILGFAGFFNETDEEVESTSVDHSEDGISYDDVSTSDLQLDYRDPFLGTVFRPPTRMVTSQVPMHRKAARRAEDNGPKEEEAEVSTPEIKYFGLIRTPGDTLTLVAMVMVNSSMMHMKPGEEKEGVQLIHADRNAAKVQFNDESIHLFKQ